jgi:hypothetical protein
MQKKKIGYLGKLWAFSIFYDAHKSMNCPLLLDASQSSQDTLSLKKIQSCLYKYNPQVFFGIPDASKLLINEQDEKPYKDFIQYLRVSYDGKTLLSISDYHQLDIYDLSNDIYQPDYQYYLPASLKGPSSKTSPAITSSSDLSSEKSIIFGESIYDVRFYPYSSGLTEGAGENANSLLLLAMKDHPIHLYDSISNQIRATYKIHNLQDELASICTINYNASFSHMFAGGNSFIYVFDLSNPSQVLSSFPTNKDTVSSKPNPFQTKGMISSIESNPDYSGLFAIGTLSGDLSLYDERALNSSSTSPSSFLTVKNQSPYGISQLKWSTCGNYLFVNCRKNDYLYCYDVRNQKKAVGSMFRKSFARQQKMIMDTDPWGQYLVTPNNPSTAFQVFPADVNTETAGRINQDDILVYDTKTFQLVNSVNSVNAESYLKNHPTSLHTTLFHPFYSILITASGERVFDSAASDSESDESDTVDEHDNPPKRRKTVPQAAKIQNHSFLSTWSLAKEQLYLEEEIGHLVESNILPDVDEEPEDGEIHE